MSQEHLAAAGAAFLALLGTITTPYAGIAVCAGMIAYFGWRFKQDRDKVKYLRERYGL